MPAAVSDFAQAQAHIAAWLVAAGQSAALLEGERPRLALRTLGWERARTSGRGTEGIKVQASYLCQPTAPSDPGAEPLLAQLFAAGVGHFDDCGPVTPGDPLWQALGLMPGPALRFSLMVQIRPEPAPAPLASAVHLNAGPLSPLGGTVVLGQRPVAGALVRPLSDPKAVRTDRRGRFALSHWTGEPLVVRKGAVEARVRPAPDASDILIDLKTEI